MLPAFLTAILFSCSTISAGRSATLIGSTPANFYRLIVAIFCLALYAHWLGQGWLGKGLFIFLMSGAVGIGIGDLLSFHALSRVGPSLTSLLVQCLCAPFAALIEWGWLGNALTSQQIGGSGVILAGSALAMFAKVTGSNQASSLNWRSRLVVVGVALAALAALAQALGAVMTRKANELNLVNGIGIDGMSAAYQRMCGAIVLVAVIYVYVQFLGSKAEPAKVSIRNNFREAAPWIVVNGLSGMVFGIACFQWALKEMPAAIALSIVALTPLLVIPLDWFINQTRPSVLSVAGGVIAVLGVLILLWS